MLKDALSFLTDLGKRAGGFQSINLPAGSLLVARNDGTHAEYPARIPDRKDKLATLDSFLAWIHDRPNVEVYVGVETVQGIVSRTAGPTADRCMMPLNQSEAWLELTSWISHGRTQPEVVRLLRGSLRGCCSDGLINVFRSLEWKSESGSVRNIKGASGDTLGRSAHREALTGGQELPEDIAFNLPVYDFDGCNTVTIPVAIEVDHDAQRVKILPHGDAIASAMIAARRFIASTIEADSDAKIYLGSYSQSVSND